MRKMGLASFLVFVAGCGAAAQTPNSADPPSNQQPHSANLADEMARVYPIRARDLNMSGRAVIHCVLTEVGGVDGCKVVSEEPQGFGFGDAAVQLSKSFRMKAKTENGKPVAGAGITIPVAFRPARPVPSPAAQ